MSLPFTFNKFLPINIQGSNAITGTYGGVSILNNGKTELKSDTTITRLGVNKNVNSSYQVDVSGNVNISGTYSVNGVPISSGGGGSTYALLTANTTMTNASPNYNGVKWTSGFNTIALPNATTITLGKEYTFFATNVLNNAIEIKTSTGQFMYYTGFSNTTTIELTTQTQSFVITCISNSSNPYWSINQAEYDPSLFVFISGSNEISADNTYTGTNVFNTSLPTSTLTPTSGTQLITKNYGDGEYGRLSSSNTWSNTNTFNGTTSISTSLTVPTITSTNGVSAKLLTTTSSTVSVSAGVLSFTATNPEATFQSFKVTFTGSPFTITQVNWASIANMPLNAEWYFILQNSTSSIITIKNNIVSNTGGTYLHADFPFDVLIQTGFNNGFIKIKRYESVEAVISAGEISNSVGGTILSILNTSNSWIGLNAFNTNLPTSTLTPSTSTHLVPKGFCDSTYQTIAGMSSYLTTTTADGTYGRLAVANNYTAQNTFTTFLPLYSGSTTPTSNNFITKAYADATYHPVGSYATLGGTNNFTAQNTFTTFLPLYSGSTTPVASNFITRAFAESEYGRLGSNNTWTGATNSFTNLPTSSQVPSSANQLVNKTYTDGTFLTPTTANSTYARLATANTFANINTFTNQVNVNNTFLVDTTSSATFYNTSNPAIGVFTVNLTADTLTCTMLNSIFTKTVGIQTGNIDALTVTNTAVFSGAIPTYTGSSTAYAANTFFPRSYGDTRYAQLAATNSFSGTTNTFTNSLIANNLLPYFPLNTASLRMGLNALQYGTASSFANVAFGNNALQGDNITPANNTGSKNVCVGYNAGASLTTTGATSPDDNVIIGYNAGKNLSQVASIFKGPSYSNVIIGSNAGQNYWIQKSVIIGTNACSAGNQFISDTTIVGYNSGLNLSNNSGVSIFGASNLPVYAGNAGQAFGCQLGTYANNNDKGVFCGINLGAYINTGWGCSFIGGDSGNGLGTGCGGVFMAGIGVDTTKADLQNSVAIGSFFTINEDDTFKIGGYNITTGAYQNLLIGNKNRILFNTSTSAATLAITFEMGEHINVTTNTTTAINLPVPANQNIGTRFTIVKSYTTPVAITITASAGLTIYASSGNTNTYSFLATEYYVTLICINSSGTAWIVTNEDTTKQYVDLTTSQTVQGVKTFQDTTGSETITSTRIETINNTASNCPNLNLLHTKSTAQAVNDTCGIITFDMKNSTAGTTTRYGNINCYVSNAGTGAEASIISITGKQAGADLGYVNLGGGVSAFTNPLRIANYWVDAARPTLITGSTSLSYTASNSFYKYNSVSVTAVATITLPTIDAAHLGNEVVFRRVGGTTTIVVSFIGNGSQNVYNTALTGGTTAQALMASGVYMVRLVPMLLSGTTIYAWFQI